SHRRAVAAREAGKFKTQIASVRLKSGKNESLIEQDEGPRAGCTMADLAKLRPAFAADGTATAGNASQISDGAAAVFVVSEAVAAGIRTPIEARIVASATNAGEPRELFTAPVGAIQKVLAKAKLRVADIDLFELNE